MSPAKTPTLPVVIVDDEEQSLQGMNMALHSAGITNTIVLTDSRQALPQIRKSDAEVLLVDLSMPYLDGRRVLEMVKEEHPAIPVIVVTATNEVETAVDCMRSGAVDYIVKPVEKSRLVSSVSRASELRELERENTLLRKYVFSPDIEHPECFTEIITDNEMIYSVFKYVEAIAQSSRPVLVTGDTGTGKELISNAIHRASQRNGKFVAVNVAGLDDNMFSDSLFGHRKGAFTGATDARKGLVEQAVDGTLFLDEIGDLSVASQVKLLRLLQDHEYFPVGSDVPKRTTARFIVATNRGIDDLKTSAGFRRDLFFRLRTHHIHMPPLKDRIDDLSLLVPHFAAEAASKLGKKAPGIPDEVYELLSAYDFPGNIRELQSMIFDAVSHDHSGTLTCEMFSAFVTPDQAGATPTVTDVPAPTGNEKVLFSERLPSLKECNQSLIEEAMRRADGNQSIAARFLGISQQALSRRLKKQS